VKAPIVVPPGALWGGSVLPGGSHVNPGRAHGFADGNIGSIGLADMARAPQRPAANPAIRAGQSASKAGHRPAPLPARSGLGELD